MAKVVKYTYDEEGRQSWEFVEVPDDAPSDNKEYIRKNGSWAEKAASINEGSGLTQPQIMARNLGC